MGKKLSTYYSDNGKTIVKYILIIKKNMPTLNILQMMELNILKKVFLIILFAT